MAVPDPAALKVVFSAFAAPPTELHGPDFLKAVIATYLAALPILDAKRAEAATNSEKPQRFRHKKRGSTYTVIGEGRVQTGGALDDMTPVTIYRSDEDGGLWARAVTEFHDGRFEEFD